MLAAYEQEKKDTRWQQCKQINANSAKLNEGKAAPIKNLDIRHLIWQETCIFKENEIKVMNDLYIVYQYFLHSKS